MHERPVLDETASGCRADVTPDDPAIETKLRVLAAVFGMEVRRVVIVEKHTNDDTGPPGDPRPLGTVAGPSQMRTRRFVVSPRHRPVSTRHRPVCTRHRPVSTRHRPVNTRHRPVSTRHRPVSTRHRSVSTRHRSVSTRHRPVSTRHRSVDGSRSRWSGCGGRGRVAASRWALGVSQRPRWRAAGRTRRPPPSA